MKHWLTFILVISTLASARGAERFADRFVWVFGWNLDHDADVPAVEQVLDAAHAHRLNGAVCSFGFDTLCKKQPEYFRRLDEVKKHCENNGLELIPTGYSIGYGGGILTHNPNLAEGIPVEDAPFLVANGIAQLVDNVHPVNFKNGGFEDVVEGKFTGYDFYDQPGVVGFVDKEIMHGGSSSLRLENFTANPDGHGRVMQTVTVVPHRCYRVTTWVKTENLQPTTSFHMMVLADGRDVSPRQFNLPATGDWRKISFLFNSLDFEKVSLYAGVWGGKTGKLWLDDFSVEETGPVNVLRRPGTPVTVRSADGTVTYVEGKDYAPLRDPELTPWRDDKPALPLLLTPDSRIQNGQQLRVSWYHSMVIYDSQVTVCMAEPELYQILDEEAKLLAEKVQPRSVLLNMDEIRMGGTCRACAGKDMGQLLGECITKQVEILRAHMPSVEVYIWSDMLDPNHNAHGNYFLVKGDFTNSWQHVPRNLIMAVWGGEPQPKSLQFFSDLGFRSLVACYYDANDLSQVRNWINVAAPMRKVRGVMYTPWLKKYALLGEFGDLLHNISPSTAPALRPAKPESAD